MLGDVQEPLAAPLDEFSLTDLPVGINQHLMLIVTGHQTAGDAPVQRTERDTVQREDAVRALATFNAQIRLKGDETHCVRGHLYDGVAMRGSRMRRICNACERITHRAQRAAQGIPPRRFKLARRYT